MEESKSDPKTDPKIDPKTYADSSTDSSTDSQTVINTETRRATCADADARAASQSDEQRSGYIQQLRWRSRRGLLELELLLLPFATDRLESLAQAALADYERLLACEDLDIYDWLQQRSAPDDDTLLNIVAAVRDYQQSHKRA